MKSVLNNVGPYRRILYLDILRIISCIAVVFIHVGGMHWGSNLSDQDWTIMNFYRGGVRWAVPVFLMISGALFLNPLKKVSVKSLFTKNILRMIYAFVFWSLVYALYSWNGDVKNFISNFIHGAGHMWYIYVIVVMYILVPIIRKFTEDRNVCLFVLACTFVVSFLSPLWVKIIQSAGLTGTLYSLIFFMLNAAKKILGYVFYFVLGYYLTCIKLNKNSRYIIYGLTILCVIGQIICLEYLHSKGKVSTDIIGNISFSVAIESIGIFVLAQNIKITPPEWALKCINLVSPCIFGVYLVHILVFEIIEKYVFNVMSFNALLSIPIMVLIVFLISVVISCICKKIPTLKKCV